MAGHRFRGLEFIVTLKQAIKRIEELERRVKELEARPPIVINNQPPSFVPYPSLPAPYQPYSPPDWPIRWGEITCGSVSAVGGIPQN